jgi:RNA recognition motif-containing protein
MSKRIFVGNLPFSATEDEIRDLFAEHGAVTSVHLVTDRESGRPRGFGFVEMEEGADEAIEALHQTSLGGRSLNVNEARPREERRPSSRRW